ncbi:MAG: GNAT family N-acetyltransferase [Clostridia bacterium]|nr:GNAT family N-acetyltransferase [Clostridia bacterium]
MEPVIRRAIPADAERILAMLEQVEEIHHQGRPDIFRAHGIKFTPDELRAQIGDDTRPIFVAELDGRVVGYTFCILGEIKDSPMLNDAKTIHLEDVCVDESCRGHAVGGTLMAFVRDYAKSIGCTRMDLDVWEFNEGARRFYEKHGFSVQKRRMDMVL